MKPQDIAKIADVVVASLAGAPGAGLLGCGSVSSTVAYDHPGGLCEANYACGGLAAFTCWMGFGCPEGFICAPEASFTCGAYRFVCTANDGGTGFSCGENYSMGST